MIEIIKKFTGALSPSGREEEIRNLIIEEIKDFVDEIKVDKLGNVIAIKKGKENGKTILFDAHIDEIGVVVTNITDDGFLRIEPVGGVSPYILLGTYLNFNGVIGVVGMEGETLKDLESNVKSLSFDHLYVDIGAISKEDALKKVKIGSFGTYLHNFAVNGNRVISKSMDDRIGCVALVESAKRIEDNINTLIFAFTVQEEIGLLGASVSAYDFDVDLAIAVDVTGVGDTPKGIKRHNMKLGEGVAIKIKDRVTVSDKVFIDFATKVAEKHNIKYQFEVLTFGGTNAYGYQRTKGGIPSGTLSIPTRYVHSPHEMIDVRDVEETIKLMVAMANENF